MQYENEILGRDAGAGPAVAEAHTEVSEDRGAMKKNMLSLVRDVAIAFAVIFVVLQFFKPTIVFEHSMEDTLHPEDYVFLAKQAYAFGDVEVGDIVVFRSGLVDENGETKNLIKRVIGLPGDVIEIKDEAVYRNGARLDEPYTKDGVTLGRMAETVVPQGSYFVLGDNRGVSQDSRSEEVGFVPEALLEGKVVFRLFPISRAGSLD